MSPYTTGDLAKSCNISVRTVQFYDTIGLLKPTALTEGGRRLYSDDDRKKMRLICLLKSLGLSLDAIKGILESDRPERVLLLLLEEQERQIDAEIGEKEKQKQTIGMVRETIKTSQILSIESIGDIGKIMAEKKNLKKLHRSMLFLALPMTVIEWGTVILWIVTGIWWPFAAGIPVVVLLGCLVSVIYFRNTMYICPECGERFRPAFREAFWANHTPKTRKLTCTACGHRDWCVETYAEKPDKGEA